MSVLVTEKKLEAACRERLGDEEVLAVGLFQPYGSGVVLDGAVGEAGNLADDLHLPGIVGGIASIAAGFAAERGLADAEGQPPWTVLAVTPTRIHAFDASAAGGTTATDDLKAEYATWDRTSIAVHTTRYVTSFTLTIDDLSTKRSWQYKGNAIYKVGGKLVAHLLAEPTPS